jgi:hypothetical protein
VGPFEEHLRDAIELNRKRAPLYSRLSRGRSETVSKWLIRSELLALPLCGIPDRWGRRFIQAGVPIVQEEFMPMRGAPAFQERFPFSPSPFSAFIPKNGNAIAASILKGYRTGGFSGAGGVASRELVALGSDHTFHPMLRHLLESVVRISNLAPLHEKRRLELSIKGSTLGLSKWMFFSHFSAFQFATWIDAKAAPLHAEGLPIVYQDVPPIPARSEFYQSISDR